MIVFLWLLIVYMALGALAVIFLIGKPRGPITPGSAVFNTVISAGIILGLLVVVHALA